MKRIRSIALLGGSLALLLGGCAVNPVTGEQELTLVSEAQEMAIEYAKQRETFGAPLASRQIIQAMIIDNELDIRQSRWMTLAAAHKAESGQPFRMEAGMAKLADPRGLAAVDAQREADDLFTELAGRHLGLALRGGTSGTKPLF